MKKSDFTLVRYDADEGKVFDWKEPHYEEVLDDEGNVVEKKQIHLYGSTLFLGISDSIDNYIEVAVGEA